MSANGAACPACQSRRTGTKDSRPFGEMMTLRRRECFDCGKRFKTYEIAADENISAAAHYRLEPVR